MPTPRQPASDGPQLRLYTHSGMTENIELYARLGWQQTDRRDELGFDRVFFSKPTHV